MTANKIDQALKKIQESIAEVQTDIVFCEEVKPQPQNIGYILKTLDGIQEQIKSLLKSDGEGLILEITTTNNDTIQSVSSSVVVEKSKYIKTTECPTCARDSERFELINFPSLYMCDGCGMTRGSVAGKWSKVFKNLFS